MPLTAGGSNVVAIKLESVAILIPHLIGCSDSREGSIATNTNERRRVCPNGIINQQLESAGQQPSCPRVLQPSQPSSTLLPQDLIYTPIGPLNNQNIAVSA